jgi:hypothetical protein
MINKKQKTILLKTGLSLLVLFLTAIGCFSLLSMPNFNNDEKYFGISILSVAGIIVSFTIWNSFEDDK